MKYRLKDRGLQKKLDEISKGDLSDALEVCSAAVASALKRGKPTTIWFGVQPQLSLEITSDMLEEVREYDPHKWNEYPEVTPPEGVWMRCETDVNAIGRKIRHVAKFDGREWRDYLSKQVVVHRFRSWDNPEDDE